MSKNLVEIVFGTSSFAAVISVALAAFCGTVGATDLTYSLFLEPDNKTPAYTNAIVGSGVLTELDGAGGFSNTLLPTQTATYSFQDGAAPGVTFGFDLTMGPGTGNVRAWGNGMSVDGGGGTDTPHKTWDPNDAASFSVDPNSFTGGAGVTITSIVFDQIKVNVSDNGTFGISIDTNNDSAFDVVSDTKFTSWTGVSPIIRVLNSGDQIPDASTNDHWRVQRLGLTLTVQTNFDVPQTLVNYGDFLFSDFTTGGSDDGWDASLAQPGVVAGRFRQGAYAEVGTVVQPAAGGAEDVTVGFDVGGIRSRSDNGDDIFLGTDHIDSDPTTNFMKRWGSNPDFEAEQHPGKMIVDRTDPDPNAFATNAGYQGVCGDPVNPCVGDPTIGTGTVYNGSNGMVESPYYFEFSAGPDTGKELEVLTLAFDYSGRQINGADHFAVYLDAEGDGFDSGTTDKVAETDALVALDGDFDVDGGVDGADFLLWQSGGSPNGTTSGDLALWEAKYGMTGSGDTLDLTSGTVEMDLSSLANLTSQAVFRVYAWRELPHSTGYLDLKAGGAGTVDNLRLVGNVVDVVPLAAVPEPTTALGLSIAVGTLLLSRRRPQ